MSAREMARILEGEAFLNSQRFRERAQYFQKVGEWLEQQPDRAKSLPENWWSYPPPPEMMQRLQPPQPERAPAAASPRREAEKDASAAPASRPLETIKPGWARLQRGGAWYVRAGEGFPEGSKVYVERSDGRVNEVTLGAVVSRDKNGVAFYEPEHVRQVHKEAPRARTTEPSASPRQEQASSPAPVRSPRETAPAPAQAAAPPAPAKPSAEPARPAAAVSAPEPVAAAASRSRRSSGRSSTELDRIVVEAESPADAERWLRSLPAQMAKLTPLARESLVKRAESRRNELLGEFDRVPEGMTPERVQERMGHLSAATRRLETVMELAAVRDRQPAQTRAAAAEMSR